MPVLKTKQDNNAKAFVCSMAFFAADCLRYTDVLLLFSHLDPSHHQKVVQPKSPDSRSLSHDDLGCIPRCWSLK